MKIEVLDHKTVKVFLSAADMQNFSLTYEQMDYHDPATRKAISQILHQLRGETDLNIDSCKLLVEAFPQEEGGCILYINLILPQAEKSERNSFDTPLIFRLETIDSVAGVSKRLVSKYSHLLIHSSLYILEGNYFLLLYTYCRREHTIISVLEEYGTLFGKGAILSAFVQEHGQQILEKDAIEVIARQIG